jgi:hypothetical protein
MSRSNLGQACGGKHILLIHQLPLMLKNALEVIEPAHILLLKGGM